MKDDGAELEREVGKLQKELHRLRTSMTEERTSAVVMSSQFLAQIDNLTRQVLMFIKLVSSTDVIVAEK